MIAHNHREGIYWNNTVNNGEWSKIESYYFTEEAAQNVIDSGLDGHIEYDEI